MGRKPRADCYTYVVVDGPTVLYVGKGTGRRVQQSARRLGGEGKIVHSGLSDDEAFAKERDLISELLPLHNVSRGGNGGRSQPKPKPKVDRALLREMQEIERIGSRVYAARFLLSRDMSAVLPASEVGEIRRRLEVVANGAGV